MRVRGKQKKDKAFSQTKENDFKTEKSIKKIFSYEY